MVKELFQVGDVLFYDKINKGISNLSAEDSETQIYFNYKQYTALGVVIAISDVESTIKVLTPNFTKIIINGIQNSDEKELIKKMQDIVKVTEQAFTKECGKQKSVKMYIPDEEDINYILDNPRVIAQGLGVLCYYCKQFLNDVDLEELLVDTNLSYVKKKHLNFLLGGVGSEIAMEYERMSYEKLKEKYNMGERTVECVRDNMDADEFKTAGDRVNIVYASDSDNENTETTEVQEKEYTSLKRSLDDIKEEFPKADILSYHIFPIMSILID